MGIGLMAHIPHELVVRSVEDIVQRYGELYGAKARSQMAGVRREGVYDIVAQLVHYGRELVDRYAFEIGR